VWMMSSADYQTSVLSSLTRPRIGNHLPRKQGRDALFGFWKLCRSAATNGQHSTSSGSKEPGFFFRSDVTVVDFESETLFLSEVSHLDFAKVDQTPSKIWEGRARRLARSGRRQVMHTANMEKGQALSESPINSLEISAIQAASPIVLALAECDEELRAEALDLFKALASGKLDEEQRIATTALLAEILFPNADHNGLPG